MESAFDPDTFMNQTIDEALDTRFVPVPEGDYPATIKSFEIKQVGQENRTVLNIIWDIQDQTVLAEIGRDSATVRQTVWLDIDQGKLDKGKGKNVGLGRLRAALGQNEPGQPWNFGALEGAGPALVRVTHRADRDDPEIVYSEVKSVGTVG